MDTESYMLCDPSCKQDTLIVPSQARTRVRKRNLAHVRLSPLELLNPLRQKKNIEGFFSQYNQLEKTQRKNRLLTEDRSLRFGCTRSESADVSSLCG